MDWFSGGDPPTRSASGTILTQIARTGSDQDRQGRVASRRSDRREGGCLAPVQVHFQDGNPSPIILPVPPKWNAIPPLSLRGNGKIGYKIVLEQDLCHGNGTILDGTLSLVSKDWW